MGFVSFLINVYRLIDVVMTHSCDRDATCFIHIPHHNVLHNSPQPPEQCVRRPELARLSAVPTRGAVEDSHLDVFSNLDSGYRLRFPPLIWTIKDQWISPVCQRAACRWEWGSDSQHQHSHRCQRSTGKPPSPWTNYILFMRPLVEKWSHK